MEVYVIILDSFPIYVTKDEDVADTIIETYPDTELYTFRFGEFDEYIKSGLYHYYVEINDNGKIVKLNLLGNLDVEGFGFNRDGNFYTNIWAYDVREAAEKALKEFDSES